MEGETACGGCRRKIDAPGHCVIEPRIYQLIEKMNLNDQNLPVDIEKHESRPILIIIKTLSAFQQEITERKRRNEK
ncbi:MAG: hypothetical protein GY765_02840 [bacterium]|nr:hypothetical protein [bacterium]